MPIIGITGSQNTKGFLQPNAPTIGTATDVGTGRAFNNGAATVTFTPAASGAAATSYTVTSSPGGFTGTGSSSPITVTGLQSNTSYTFTVTGTNGAGTGPASSASSSITATTVPQAPTIGTATPTGGTTATVAYTAGANGGKAVSAFTATSSPSGITGTGASPITVSTLAQATAYTFTVTATNANGTSLASSASASITTFKLTLNDTFDRANGALGTSSDGLSSWTVNRGSFSVDSNLAYSADANSSLATVALSTANISNAQVDMHSDTGGMGLAIWTTDANSYWSIYPYYTSTTNSSQVTTCTGGPGGTFSSGQASPANACGVSCVGPYDIYIMCGGQEIYCCGGRAQCAVSESQSNILNGQCGPDNWYINRCTGGTCTVNATNVTNTVNTTNYTSAIKISNQSGVQHTNQYASSFNPTRSIGVSTSGNTISYVGYNAVSKGGSAIVSSTYNPGTVTQGPRVGVFKTSSPHNQGSYLNNISVTVV
jgi:hypothetical protein